MKMNVSLQRSTNYKPKAEPILADVRDSKKMDKIINDFKPTLFFMLRL